MGGGFYLESLAKYAAFISNPFLAGRNGHRDPGISLPDGGADNLSEITGRIRRMDGESLVIHHALQMAEVFFRVDPSAVGPNAYDQRVLVSCPDRITEEDIHAINGTMAARSPLKAWQALIRAGPVPWLAALDPSWDLLQLSDTEWGDLDVEQRLHAAFQAVFGPYRRLAVVTKVLYMKRPRLVPVCDSFVLHQLGAPPGTDGDPRRSAAVIGHLRREGQGNVDALVAIQDRLRRENGVYPSPLRIFEALIWQSHPDTWYQKLAPLISTWLGSRTPGEEP